MKRRGTGWHMLLLPVLLGWAASPAAGAPADLRSIDWSRILSGLSDVIEARDASPTAEPISTATSVATPSRTSPGTATASLTPTDTVTPSRTPTSTPTHTASHTLAPPPTSTPPPTATPTNTATPTFTATDTPSPTHTEPPTSTQTPTFTRTPEPTPTTPAGQIGFVGAGGVPPAQRLASAFVVFPYVVSDADTDTRITLLNMTNDEQSLSCFYVRQSDCVEIGFFVRLTAQQPLSWLASEGTSNVLNFTAVPPFDGVGELKCAAMPRRPELRYHNVAHGRAIVFDRDESQTVAYGGIGFQRLAPGPFTGVISLDGSTYEQCPDRLHFQVLTRQGGSNSTLITVPCQQDLYTQVPTETVVQLAIISEFEQVFSSSFRFSCHDTRSFSQLSTLSKSVLGSDTAHVVARGVQSPIIGMVIDRFDGIDSHTAANNPFLEGGRASTVFFP